MTNIIQCTTCGQALKNIFYIGGKPYGMDCAGAITGMKSWELRATNGNVDEYQQKRANELKKYEENRNRVSEIFAKNRQENAWLLEFLEATEEQERSPFANSMIHLLERGSIHELSHGQFDALKRMYSYEYKKCLAKGIREAEFVFASGRMDINDAEALEDQKYRAVSFATLKELKEIAKENGIKGITKMDREKLEEIAVKHIYI